MAGPERAYEPERHVFDESLVLDCQIYGQTPVQAEGRLAGRPLYFRARHDFWTFTLCTNADVDPSCLRPGNETGFFRDGEFEGFELTGNYGTPHEHEASFMPYAEAERLIRECASRYLRATGSTLEESP